jgi:hypothetical protein
MPRLGPFTPGGGEPRYALCRRLGEPQGRSGSFGEEVNFLPLPRFEPWIMQPVAYAISSLLFEYICKLLTGVVDYVVLKPRSVCLRNVEALYSFMYSLVLVSRKQFFT